jgi:opacity protein-like surface antigen
VVVYRQAPRPPPYVVYAPPPPPYYYRSPPPYYYRPRPAKPIARPNEWGLNLRLEGALQGSGSQSSSPMTGAGFGLRYKPVPAFGLEAGFDFLGGRDYNNDHRNETEFTVNAMVFVNPKSRVQVYFLAGLGGSWAHVDQGDGDFVDYTYFGGQAGGGLEFRLATHFALNVDLRGFVRGRTDSNAQYSPEFVNPQTGATTNTSGGGLLTGGMTIYF